MAAIQCRKCPASPIRDSLAVNRKRGFKVRLLHNLADGLVMECIGIGERFDLDTKVLLENSLLEPMIKLFSQARYCSSLFPILAFREV
jgi:hypothetical protein